MSPVFICHFLEQNNPINTYSVFIQPLVTCESSVSECFHVTYCPKTTKQGHDPPSVKSESERTSMCLL